MEETPQSTPQPACAEPERDLAIPPFLAALPDSENLQQFYLRLSSEGRAVLDDLFARTEGQLFAIRNARHPLPYLVNLVALLIEEHKEVARLRAEVEALTARDWTQMNPGERR